jgi:hypothetical protein
VHTAGRQVESHPTGLRMQLDDNAFVVLEIGDRTALDDRHASCDCRIVAAEIRRAGQIIDLTLGGNTGAADVSDRNARDFELVLFLVPAVVKRSVTPAIADTDRDHAAAQPHVASSCEEQRLTRRHSLLTHGLIDSHFLHQNLGPLAGTLHNDSWFGGYIPSSYLYPYEYIPPDYPL